MAEEKLPQFAEDEDLARAKAFWNENGKPIMFGIAIGLAGIVGYNYWSGYQQAQGETASMLYEQVRGNTDTTDFGGALEELKLDHPKSAYSALSSLMDAKNRVDSGDLDGAALALQWVLDNSPDKGLNHIARLRLATVYIAQGEADAALSLLTAQETGSFESRYAELMGDAYMRRGNSGDTQLAREAYQQSLDNMPVGSTHTALVQLKLDNLGEI